MTTQELEVLAYRKFSKLGTYLCLEVAIPTIGLGKYSNYKYRPPLERVDLLSYDTTNTWKMYEIKLTKNDFYSKAAHSLYGHYNYYIMPEDVYTQVYIDIPKHIGVYIPTPNNKTIKCITKAKKQELLVKHNKLMFNFMQAFSREYAKYRYDIECHIKHIKEKGIIL